jgi:hypothetical protein
MTDVRDGKSIKEQIKEKIAGVAGDKAEEILEKIEEKMNQPAEEIAEATVELTTKEKLLKVMKNHSKKSGEIAWNATKAVVAGGITLIPILGGAGEAATAELVDAAILEGATEAEAVALAHGAVVNEAGQVVTPLIKLLGEKGAEKVVKFMKKVDPYPDVPTKLVLVAGIAAAAGIEGAGTIPAVVEMLILQYKRAKLDLKTAMEIGKIVKGRLEAMSTPKAAEAAAAFAN